MKKKLVDPVVTQSMLDKQTNLLLERFQEYRDEVLTRMDKDAGELEQIREDQVFMNHDIKNHEERIARLETSTKIV